MPASSTSQSSVKWTPSVSFYFQVVFQKTNCQPVQVSFSEVNGLSWDMGKRVYRGNNGEFQAVPTGMTYTNLVLKRPLGPLSGFFSKWIKECHDFMYNARKRKDMKAIPTYDVVIYLLNEESVPKASWQCTRAYPMKWSLGAFDSIKSELATETIELAYAYMERIQ